MHGRLARVRSRGAVPVEHHAAIAGVGEQRQIGQRPIRIGDDLGDEVAEADEELLQRLAAEELGADQIQAEMVVLVAGVGLEVEARDSGSQRHAGRLRHLGRLLIGLRFQLGVKSQRPGRKSTELRRNRWAALEHEADLEERVATHVAVRTELANHHVERHLGVVERAHGDLAHTTQHLAEARFAGEVRAEHHHVDEESDHAGNLGTRSRGDRRADDDVFLSAVTLYECRERRQQEHIRRDTFAASQVPEGDA